MQSWRHLTANQMRLERTLDRLSSGLRITRAADDASGLSISQRMLSQYRGLGQAVRNAQDGLSLLNVADGSLGQIQALLQRGRELSVQAANGTLTSADRGHLQIELSQILTEVDRVTEAAEFNRRPLLTTGPNGAAVAATLTGLRSGWLEQAEALISSQYGIEGNGASMTVILEQSGPQPAWISGTPGVGGRLDGLAIHINLQDFGAVSGPDGGTAPMFNDRKVARVLTQAVLSQNSNFGTLPSWFVSGASDYIAGGDELLSEEVASYGAAAVVGAISSWSEDSLHQSSAYLAVKYLDSLLPPFSMTDVMTELMMGNDLDTALMNTLGIDSATFLADFQANGAAYQATLNLSDADVGAIGGGDASTVIPNGGTYTLTPLTSFDLNWSTDGWSTPSPIDLQVGANQGDRLSFEIPAISTAELNLLGLDLVIHPSEAIDALTMAIERISAVRGDLGAVANRLEHTLNVNHYGAENQLASYSRITDADYALELASLARHRILLASSSAVLSRTIISEKSVLRLLRL